MIILFLLLNSFNTRSIRQQGQLLTRDHFPIGAELTIQYSDSQVRCDQEGFFSLKAQQFTVDVLGLFSQTFYPSKGQNKFIIDNNQTVTITIAGSVKQNATISIKILQPLHLMEKKYIIQGEFTITKNIMKMLVYQVIVIAEAPDFKEQQLSLYLYGNYIGTVGNIVLKPTEAEVEQHFKYENDEDCYLMCDNLYLLSAHSSNNEVIFKGKLFDQWPQKCLLYSEDGKGEIVTVMSTTENQQLEHNN